MSDIGRQSDPGDGLVSAATRAFELEDEQVFSGAGRGPTPDEAAAAERYGPASERTVDSYREMMERGSHQAGEGRLTL
ncbi:MAG TPA: hypothetical protein VFZ97_05225 [Acidimicrobiales bacterium]